MTGMSFLEELKQITDEREKKQESNLSGLWKGHSVFQADARVLGYGGEPAAVIALNLYQRASGMSYNCVKVTDVCVKVLNETLCERTGLSTRTVERGIKRLNADGHFKSTRTRNKRTGRRGASAHTPLHPETREPLKTSPANFGLCAVNGLKPYITMTREALAQVNLMTKASHKAVYVAAFQISGLLLSTSFKMDKDFWRHAAHVGKNAFADGVKYCANKKLLSYKRGVLTLHDPLTGQPSERWKHEHGRIEHDNPKWKNNLNDVTEDQWKIIISKLLPGKEFITDADGWSCTTRGVVCPFCKTPRSFRVNFKRSQYQCFNDACGENSKGRLCPLVQRVLRVSASAAKSFIKGCIEEHGRGAAA
jgi:hypothetical protein